MTIWQFQRKLAGRLLAWSMLSIVAGFGFLLDSYRPIRAIGVQFIAWGGIDGAIALFGRWSASRRQRTADAAASARESANLRRLLWINSGLDLLYIGGGLLLVRKGDDERVAWAGHGRGVFVQGLFLLIFDTIHALRVPSAER